MKLPAIRPHQALKAALEELREPLNNCNLPRLVTIKGFPARSASSVREWRIYLDHR